jgi:serine/threonine protein kinase
MGMGDNKHKVYLIDFGLANFYRNSDGSHMEYRTDAPFRGTHRYASINAHFKIEQSRRDDLEGLGYVLLYFMRGGLPWQNVNCSRRKRRKVIGDAKKSYTLEELCQGLPPEFKEYMETVRSLQYDTEPPYRHLRKLFKRCFRREGFRRDNVFDWTREEPTTPSGSLATADGPPVRQPSESSLSTMEDDPTVPVPRYEPGSLKRHRDEGHDEQEPAPKRPRLENPGQPIVLSSLDDQLQQQQAAQALGGLGLLPPQ